jgi:uncharacterized protein (DUF1778 family)
MDPDQKALLEDAAAVSGRTLTDLITEGARKEAIQIMREEEEIKHWKLSRADSIAFVEALLEDPKPTEQMVKDWEDYLESKRTRFLSTPPDRTNF